MKREYKGTLTIDNERGVAWFNDALCCVLRVTGIPLPLKHELVDVNVAGLEPRRYERQLNGKTVWLTECSYHGKDLCDNCGGAIPNKGM